MRSCPDTDIDFVNKPLIYMQTEMTIYPYNKGTIMKKSHKIQKHALITAGSVTCAGFSQVRTMLLELITTAVSL